MNYSKGQVVVHPHHGPATITAINTRNFKGERHKYLKLKVTGTDLTVGVPLERAEEAGLRAVLDAGEVRELFEVFVAEGEEEASNWSRRIKANTDRFRSGDIKIIAGLVRDLTRREEEKGLSFGERSLLRDALAPLVCEIGIVLSASEDDATALVTSAILEGNIPELPELTLAS